MILPPDDSPVLDEIVLALHESDAAGNHQAVAELSYEELIAGDASFEEVDLAGLVGSAAGPAEAGQVETIVIDEAGGEASAFLDQPSVLFSSIVDVDPGHA